MLLIDRYILHQFFMNFVILLVVVVGLFVTIDVIVDMDEFLEAGQYYAAKQLAEPLADEEGIPLDVVMEVIDRKQEPGRLARNAGVSQEIAETLLAACVPNRGQVVWGTVYKLFDFYIPAVLVILVYLSGLAVVGAMGFTLTALLKQRELVALVASGVSLYRVAAPLVVAGVVLNGITLPLQEFLIPPLAPKLIRSKNQAKYDTIDTFAQYLVPDGKGALLSTARFDAAKGELNDLVINIRDAKGVTVERISAPVAIWDASRSGWELKLASSLIWDPQAEDWRLKTQSTLGRAADDPASGGGGLDSLEFFETPLSPQVLLARRAETYSGFLSLSQLQEMQANEAVPENLRTKMTQTIWSRFSLMVVNTLLLLISLPGFLRLTAGNLLVESVKAAGLSIGCWSTALMMMQANIGLNPISTAWLPVVVMLPLSFVMLQRVRS